VCVIACLLLDVSTSLSCFFCPLILTQHVAPSGQYHAARPYIKVTSIPNFDPTALPYWDIYQREGTASTIRIGGTIAGEFIAGLSGGQRKLLFFELVRQRIAGQSDLLIALDEPFSGVTDDFVPFIVERLQEMRQQHNILLVTNDHVATLTGLADNTLQVSAVDRTVVRINNREAVDREKAIMALSIGDPYVYKTGMTDIKFFFDVEVLSNSSLLAIIAFTLFLFSMFLFTFWNSDRESAALVLIAGDILSYFSLNPYLLSAVDWRNYTFEESEALMHASVNTNLFLRTCLTFVFILLIATLEFAIVNAVIDGLGSFKFWLGIFFDTLSTTLPLVCLAVFSRLPMQMVEVVGALPFLLMIFMSTTFSPGAGVPVLKEFRYLFPRFYFWCYVPVVEDQMEGCPSDSVGILYMALSGFTFTLLFICIQLVNKLRESHAEKKKSKSAMHMLDSGFEALQLELYGEKGHQHFHRLKSKLSSGLAPEQ
jgi:hypothetical protein